MEDLRNREYNGWENRWTWLVHLHLSSEQALFLEIAQLVATEPENVLAGRSLGEVSDYQMDKPVAWWT